MTMPFTNFFPAELDSVIRDSFSSVRSPPVLLKLLSGGENIAPDLLHNRERDQLNKYKLPKRRSEYVTGRICAKLATAHYLQFFLQSPPQKNRMEVYNDTHGRPFIMFHTDSSFPVPAISISHSEGYAAAMTAQHHCGIDIQGHNQSLIKVKEKYCTDQEYTLLSDITGVKDATRRLSLLWAAKEAIQKTFSTENGTPTFSRICLQGGEKKKGSNVIFSFQLFSKEDRCKSRKVAVVAGTFQNHAIAVSALKENL